MSKGSTKTVIERQINIYNQFQYEIRQMDRLGINRKRPVTADEIIANNILIAKEESAKADKENLIKEFLKTRPEYGSMKGLSAEEAARIGAERTAWTTQYHRFLKSIK